MQLRSPALIDEYTARGWWGRDTFKDIFERTVQRSPEAIALVDPLNRAEITDGPPRRLTYRELDDQVRRLAQALIEQGVGKDDIVAVLLPNTIELVALYLAASHIGAVLSPLPWQYREYELTMLLPFIAASHAITCARIGGHQPAAMIAGLRDQIPSLRAILAFGDDVPDGVVALDPLLAQAGDPQILARYASQHPVDANDLITICWTSGTEGRPKGVPRSYNDWWVPAYGTLDAAELTAGSVLLNPFPLTAMGGIAGMLCTWLLTGGTLVQHHPFSLPTFLQQIATERVEFTVAPPVLLNMLLQNPAVLGQADLSSLRAIGSGAAPLSPWMVKTWQEQYNLPVINYFGSNEGMTIVGSHRDIPDPETRASLFPRFGSPRHTWSNRVAGWMETRLVGPDGAEISAAGQPGEMYVRGPAVFAGYFNDPAISAQCLDGDGFYRTGDVFELAGEGDDLRYYRFVGRLKDIIIRGGMNISAEEIETLLQGHSAIAEVAVVGYPDETMGERACACVVAKPEQDITLADLVAYLKERRIAAYKYPERLHLLGALPRNPMGKVIKRDLREQLIADSTGQQAAIG